MEQTKENIKELLRDNLGIRSIAKKLKKSPSTISQHLKELLKKNEVIKNGSVWLLPQEANPVRSVSQGTRNSTGNEGGHEDSGIFSTYNDRAHNIEAKYNVVHIGEFKDTLYQWERINLNNNVQYLKKFGDWSVRYTGKSLILKVPIIKAQSSREAIRRAKELCIEFLRRNDAEFKGLKVGGWTGNVQIIKQHHAVQQEPLSKYMYRNKLSYMSDNIHVDASEKGVPELEFTNSEESGVHHERYINMVEDVVLKNPLLLSDLTNQLNEVDKRLVLIAQVQINTANSLNTMVEMVKPKLVEKSQKLKNVDYIG